MADRPAPKCVAMSPGEVAEPNVVRTADPTAHQIDERQKIFRLVKDVIAGIPAVQNVTQKPTLRCS